MKAKNIQDRLVQYSENVISLANTLPYSMTTKHIKTQISRSSTSVALNHAESIEAESRRDFAHKLKICLKELRETETALKIIERTCTVSNQELFDKCKSETDELIGIFVVSLSTLRKNGI